MSGLRRALIGLADAGVALGLAALALVTSADRRGCRPDGVGRARGDARRGASRSPASTRGWRRPDNRTGALMTLVGFLWFLGALTSADTAWVYTLGLLLTSLWVGALVHMLVAFPTGRVEPGLERGVVTLGWAIATVGPLLVSLVTAHPADCTDCPANRLLVWDDGTAEDVVTACVTVIEVGLLVSLVVVLIRHWRAFGPVQRRALSPVLWTGSARRRVGRRDGDRGGIQRRHDQRRARRGADGGRRDAAVRLPARPAALEPVARRCGERAVRAARWGERARRARRRPWATTRWPWRTGCRTRGATWTRAVPRSCCRLKATTAR